jgi:hypothetical protein
MSADFGDANIAIKDASFQNQLENARKDFIPGFDGGVDDGSPGNLSAQKLYGRACRETPSCRERIPNMLTASNGCRVVPSSSFTLEFAWRGVVEEFQIYDDCIQRLEVYPQQFVCIGAPYGVSSPSARLVLIQIHIRMHSCPRDAVTGWLFVGSLNTML